MAASVGGMNEVISGGIRPEVGAPASRLAAVHTPDPDSCLMTANLHCGEVPFAIMCSRNFNLPSQI